MRIVKAIANILKVRGRWTAEETLNIATYPRLTTRWRPTNFVASDFWLYDTSRFDLNRVQLSYDFQLLC